MSIAESKLESMGLSLPDPAQPVANYVRALRVGDLLFVSGTGVTEWPDGTPCAGKLGQDLSVERGYEAAKLVGLSLIATLKQYLGDLDRVQQVVKLLGMVNAVPEFTEHPQVINGCSDLLVAVFGDKGRHTRSAVGMGSLPMDIPVEIEIMVLVSD
jgi:enamine deaminase RidA (YjgF/YER057c/UK114 family)